MTQEEYTQILKKGCMYTALAYILMDCSDSCMMFAIDQLKKVDCVLPPDQQAKIKIAIKTVENTRNTVNDLTKDLYNNSSADTLIDDADWLLECILEIIARTNNNEYAREDMLQYIKKKKQTIKTL